MYLWILELSFMCSDEFFLVLHTACRTLETEWWLYSLVCQTNCVAHWSNCLTVLTDWPRFDQLWTTFWQPFDHPLTTLWPPFDQLLINFWLTVECLNGRRQNWWFFESLVISFFIFHLKNSIFQVFMVWHYWILSLVNKFIHKLLNYSYC